MYDARPRFCNHECHIDDTNSTQGLDGHRLVRRFRLCGTIKRILREHNAILREHNRQNIFQGIMSSNHRDVYPPKLEAQVLVGATRNMLNMIVGKCLNY